MGEGVGEPAWGDALGSAGLGVRVAEESVGGDRFCEVGVWVGVAALLLDRVDVALLLDVAGVSLAADVSSRAAVSDALTSLVGVGVLVGLVRKLAMAGRVPSSTSMSGPGVVSGVCGVQAPPMSVMAIAPIARNTLSNESGLRRARTYME